MLASRCGYVCRSCRAETAKVLQHEQRRRQTNGGGSPGGKQEPVEAAEAGSEVNGKTEAEILGAGRMKLSPQEWRMRAMNGKNGSLPKGHAIGMGKPSVSTDASRSKSSASDANTGTQKKRILNPRQIAVKLYRQKRQRHQPKADCEAASVEGAGTGKEGVALEQKGAAIAKKGQEIESHSADGPRDDFLNVLDRVVEKAEASEAGKKTKPKTGRGPSTRRLYLNGPNFTPGDPISRQADSAWMSNFMPKSRQFHGLHARMLHTSRGSSQQAEAVSELQPSLDGSPPPASGIRAHLRRWQELHGEEDDPPPVTPQDDVVLGDAPYNDFARLPDEARMRIQAQKDELEMEQESAAGYVAASGREGYDGSSAVEDARFLIPGDLVEIEFTRSERESLLAIYIRPIGSTGNYAQFLTMQGKWLHQSERSVQYRLKGFADTDTLNAIIPHLPYPETMADIQALVDRAYTEDLSIPREVVAPLIARMVKFHDDSQEIYRQHANALDDAHHILAHDTDLWYGTLTTAASTLLKIPAASLPEAAVFAVRKALVHAGFAFNMDRRSHRQTGFFQIRSKAQVKNVEQVRSWVRQWQDDLAKTAGMSKQARKFHSPSRGAQYVYSFIEKSKIIAMKSRETRQPTDSNNIGISKTRIPLSDNSDCVKITTGEEFTEEEQEIVRFMEAWSCTNMFLGLNRIESLPPLILHATGLYPNSGLTQEAGYLFLQEIGTLLPYENRVRFDQHLLLPSSQHSKPLQNLMAKLMDMRDTHNFQDSMAGLRHDWKDLPVYCIDGADAHEIDDGISLEPAGKGSDGRKQHWVHIHIANPTAFFDRNHPLAKMARHMGETIYMPERTYMMLPRWATQRHFSLAPNRPCLTFSAKMDADGKTVEQKVTPGIIRNVISLTPSEIEALIGDDSLETKRPMQTYSVGGTPPPPRARKSRVPDMQQSHISQLSTLNALAGRRAGIRKSAGGLFFDAHKPEVSVWQNNKQTGLAWDHPHRRGSRTVEGDPIIQLKTRGLSNWFEPSANAVDVLVREFMLLACEISASWCAERDIPIIYRGTTISQQSEAEREKFMKEQIAPNTAADGTYPMWLGVQYLRTIGFTALRTEPIRHGFLGMAHYSKVTSPLRRYGDMILHWQIEAALRHEASTGESLVVSKRKGGDNRGLQLPFSKAALESIMLGLQPREQIVSRSQSYAETFWVAMLLFRKHHFNEDGGFEGFPTRQLPVANLKEGEEMRLETVPIFRAFINNRPDTHSGAPYIPCFLMEFNITASLIPLAANEGEEVRLGDLWECRIERVDMFKRMTVVRAVGLVAREAL